MKLLAVLLLAPWFAVLGWIYWRTAPAPFAAARGFDLAALTAAVALSVAGMALAHQDARADLALAGECAVGEGRDVDIDLRLVLSALTLPLHAGAAMQGAATPLAFESIAQAGVGGPGVWGGCAARRGRAGRLGRW